MGNEVRITISAATAAASASIEKFASQAKAELSAMAQAAQAALKGPQSAASAMETLGIRTSKAIAEEARKSRDAYRALIAQGVSGADLSRAETAMREHFGRLRKEMGQVSAAPLNEVSNGVDTLSQKMARMAHIGAAMFVAPAVIDGLRQMAGSLVAAQLAGSKLSASLEFSAGSAKGATAEIAYLSEVSNRLGLDFATASDAYAKFAASARASGLSGEVVKSVFEGVAKASTRFGLSAEETSGALLALSQMASKGVVSMEELRGQLGERLPGAFHLAAEAMGLTEKEMIKLVESGQLLAGDFLPKFGRALNDAIVPANGLAQELNRLSGSWEQFKRALVDADGGGFQFWTDGINEATASMKALGKETGFWMKLLAANAGFQKGAFGLWGGATEDTAQAQKAKLAEYARLKQDIAAMGSGPLPYIKAGERDELVARKNAVRDELTALALRRGKETFQLPDLKGEADRSAAKEQDVTRTLYDNAAKFAAAHGDLLAKRRLALADFEKDFSALQTSNPAYYAQLKKNLLDSLEKKQPKAKTGDRDRVQLEARAAQAHLAPATMKEIERLNAELDKRNLSEETYLQLAGVAMAHDPLIAQNTKAIADQLKEEAQATALVNDYRGNNQTTLDRIAREAELAQMNERQRLSIEAVYKADDDAQQMRERIIRDVKDEAAQKQALADVEGELATQKLKVAAAVEASYDAQRSFAFGWKTAFQRYQDEASNAAKTAEQVFTKATDSMADALTQFAMTGKLDFSSLANSMIADMIRMQMRAAMAPVTNGIGNWIQGLFNGGNVGAGQTVANTASTYSIPIDMSSVSATPLMHSGGIVGSGEGSGFRNVRASLFDRAHKYHTGGIAGNEVPTILKKGEGVFTEGQMEAMGGGSTTFIFNNFDTPKQVSQKETVDSRGNRRIEATLNDLVAPELSRPGSATNKSLRNGFGLQPMMVGR